MSGRDGGELLREVLAWLDKLPGAVRVHEGGGPENVAASFAVNQARLVREAEAREAALRKHIEGLAAQINASVKILEPHFRNVDPMPGDCMIGVSRTVTLYGYVSDIVKQLAAREAQP